jgi:hypothetical protein
MPHFSPSLTPPIFLYLLEFGIAAPGPGGTLFPTRLQSAAAGEALRVAVSKATLESISDDEGLESISDDEGPNEEGRRVFEKGLGVLGLDDYSSDDSGSFDEGSKYPLYASSRKTPTIMIPGEVVFRDISFSGSDDDDSDEDFSLDPKSDGGPTGDTWSPDVSSDEEDGGTPTRVQKQVVYLSGQGLEMPVEGEVAKKRKLPTFCASKQRRKSTGGSCVKDPSKGTLSKRVLDNPGNGLSVSGTKLFCAHCKCLVCGGKQPFEAHLVSAQHLENRNKDQKSGKDMVKMTDCITTYVNAAADEGLSVHGLQTVDKKNQEARSSILKEILTAGMPPSVLHRSHSFVGFLEYRIGVKLGSVAHMVNTYTPIILDQHELLIEEAVRGKSVCVMDDAMTYQGEQYAIVLRLLDEVSLEASMLLVELGHWATSLSHTNIVAIFFNVLGMRLKINPDKVVSRTPDRCSVNIAANTRFLEEAFTGMDPDFCLPHTFDNLLQKLNTPSLKSLRKCLNTMLSLSTIGKVVFKEETLAPWTHAPATRWTATVSQNTESIYPAVVIDPVTHRPRILEFLLKMEVKQLCSQSVATLLPVVEDKRMQAILHFESAVVNHVSLPIVEHLVTMEGDKKFEYLRGFEAVEKVHLIMLNPLSTAFIKELVLIAAEAPSLLTAAAQLSASGRVVRAGAAASQQRVFAALRLRGAAESEEEEEEEETPVPLSYMEFVTNADLTKVEVLKAQVIEFVKPMLVYFARVFEIELNPMMLRMQAGRDLLDPLYAKDHIPSTAAVDRVFELFRSLNVASLDPTALKEACKRELPLYKSLLDAIPNRESRLDEDGHDTYDIVAWWAQAIVKLPALKKVLIIVATHSPSSCAPERVFSVLNRTFGAQRSSTRQDVIKLSTMLQFNKL